MQILRAGIAAMLGVSALVAGSGPLRAATPGLADSFRLGSGGGVLCRVQTRSSDAAMATMFDRSWAIVCRDAAKPIGTVRALRGAGGEAEARALAARADTAVCTGRERESVDQLAHAVGVENATHLQRARRRIVG